MGRTLTHTCILVLRSEGATSFRTPPEFRGEVRWLKEGLGLAFVLREAGRRRRLSVVGVAVATALKRSELL